MRWFTRAIALALALAATSCQTGGGSSGAGDIRLPEHGTLFMKVFNEDPAKTGAPEVAVKLDGENILDRNFTTNAKSYDGQYQIRLPQGRHVLEASTPQGATFTSRAFNLKDKAFIQIYVTGDNTFHLTSGSRRSLVRLVIKRMRAARGVNSDPALWMIIPAPQPSPSTRDAAKKKLKAKAAESLGLPSATTTQRGK